MTETEGDKLFEEATAAGWDASLIWCPSQLYKEIKIGETLYTLYLRWRWSDPWEGHIISQSRDEMRKVTGFEHWSPDLFALCNQQYSQDETMKACAALEELAPKWIEYQGVLAEEFGEWFRKDKEQR